MFKISAVFCAEYGKQADPIYGRIRIVRFYVILISVIHGVARYVKIDPFDKISLACLSRRTGCAVLRGYRCVC